LAYYKLTNAIHYKYVRLKFGDGRIPRHSESLSGRAPRARRPLRGLASMGNTCRRAPIRLILGFGEAKFPKMGDSCSGRSWTTVQILTLLALYFVAGEIRNRTYKQTNKQTNSTRYIHTLPIGYRMCG